MYFSFSQYLKSRFSFPVYKASIDAGFICPNMDGTRGFGGCTFCNNASFSPAFRVRKENISEQLNINILRHLKLRPKIARKNPRFIAFFQAFTGTYGPVDIMYEWWQEALKHPQVVGVSISTRADCIHVDILDHLAKLKDICPEIWLEIGVESTHNQTLLLTNRGHTYQEVVEAVSLIRQYPFIKLCLHLIHGLPKEDEAMMLESVEKINQLKPDAVKFHHLEVIKDTVLSKEHLINPIPLFSMEDYFEILGKSLQRLESTIIIQRLFSHSPDNFLIAPHWNHNKEIQQLFLKYLEKNNIHQGQLVQR